MNKSNNAWLGKTLKATADLVILVLTINVFTFIIGQKQTITIDFVTVVSLVILFGSAAMITLLAKGRKSKEESTKYICMSGLACHVLFFVISFVFYTMHF